MSLKIKYFSQVILGIAVYATTGPAIANSNPCNVDCVNEHIADAIAKIPSTPSATLTADDWAAVCQTGTINSPAGCYGDISSPAFAKINGAASNLTNINAISGGGANTVWLRQLGSGTACTSTGNNVQVFNASTLSTDWLFGAFSIAGLNYVWYDDNIGYDSTGYDNITPQLQLIPSAATSSFFTTSSFTYATQGGLPTIYLMIISASSTNKGSATPFQQSPQAAFNSTTC
ncbi:MAG: hypothetical protein NTW94_00110 [Legionellales bacterium]|nr:hypothetical protein [Legionellales bacterium]